MKGGVVKRRVVTAHLVGREMFRKVLHKQLLSSRPLAVKGTCPLPMGPQEGHKLVLWLLWGQQPDDAVQGQSVPRSVFAMGRYPLVFTAW